MSTYYKIKMDFEIGEENIVDFLEALKPYGTLKSLVNHKEVIISVNRKKISHRLNTIYQRYRSEIMNNLNQHNKMSTDDLGKALHLTHSHKTLYRLLMKMKLEGLLIVEKRRDNNTIKNFWRLNNE